MSTPVPTLEQPVAPDGREAAPRPSLVVHTALFALVLAVVAVLTPSLRPWTSDDGAYAHAVHLLERTGGWADDELDLDLDDDPARYPFALSEVDEAGRAYPYARHPAWVLVLRASSTVFGDRVGFVLPNLLAMVAAAHLAGRVAALLGARRPELALWLVGLGPLLVTGPNLWAHAVSAALGGCAALAAVRLVEHRSPARAAAMGGALAGALLVRSEGLLLALALVAALFLVRPGRWTDPRRAVDPVIAGGIAATVWLVEQRWVAAIVDGQTVSTGPQDGGGRGWLASRPAAAWRLLASGVHGDRAGELVSFGALLLLVAGVLLVARGARITVAGAAITGGVVLGLARLAEHPGAFVSGILPAWPVALAGLVAYGLARHRAGRAELVLVVASALFVGAVVATQYAEAGGLEWGGRFLMPIAAPVGVLAALGLERTVMAAPSDERRERSDGVVLAGLGITALVSLLGTHVSMDLRAEAHQAVVAGRDTDADLVVALGEYLPRYDLSPEARTVWVRTGRADAAQVVSEALADGARTVAVVGTPAEGLDVPGATASEAADGLVTVFRRTP